MLLAGRARILAFGMVNNGSDLIFNDIVGRSRQIRRVIKRIRDVAELDIPVLISGESGVGKELVARAIHNESTRRRGPFQAVNTGSVPSDLVSSELFGHEKGSFTGATTARAGLFESAQGGTLFLDEIATMGEEMQIALLRVLETREYSRVGASDTRESDVRVIAATNATAKRGRAAPNIRRDLFYRLNVYTMEIPPLRQRRDDIPVLCHHFLARVGRRLGKQVAEIAPAAMRQLKSYGWPGNVRELINVITRLIVGADGTTIEEPEVIEALYSAQGEPAGDEPVRSPNGGGDPSAIAHGQDAPDTNRLQPGQTIEEAERELIRVTLDHVQGNRTRAAKLLGISRKSLYNKIKLYQLDT